MDVAKLPASPGLFVYDLKNDGLAFGKLLLGSEGTGAKTVRTPLSAAPQCFPLQLALTVTQVQNLTDATEALL